MANHSPLRRAFDRTIGYRLEAALVHGLFALLSLLSLRRASDLGGWVGRTLGPRLRANRKVRNHLRLALPELSEEARADIARQCWDNLGRTMAEYPHIKTIAREWDRHVTLVGREHLEALRDDGKPGICITGHFANWELAALACHKVGLPLTIVYRAPNNPWIDRLLAKARGPLQGFMVPKGPTSARAIMTAIRQGRHIGILPDQKLNEGIPVPFFGRDAMTGSFTADLSMRYDAPLVPIKVTRDGAHFHIQAFPPFVFETTGDREPDTHTAMRHINAMLEEWVRQTPGQWLWTHKRWPD